jgi:hypothetical protein
MRRVNTRAIHIGADELAWPGHAHLCVLRSCRDTLARMTRLAHAAAIQEQHWLAGTQATCAAVAETIECGATTLAHGGLLVVTFSGHTVRHHDQTFWCLHDGELPLDDLAARLAGTTASAQIVVVADTCYGAALAALRRSSGDPGLDRGVRRGSTHAEPPDERVYCAS